MNTTICLLEHKSESYPLVVLYMNYVLSNPLSILFTCISNIYIKHEFYILILFPNLYLMLFDFLSKIKVSVILQYGEYLVIISYP